MTNYTQRKVTLYELPINEKTVLLNPEEAILKYGQHGTLDIGSYCYLDRSNNKNRLQHEGRPVNLKSINEERIKHIRKLIQLFQMTFLTLVFQKKLFLIKVDTFYLS